MSDSREYRVTWEIDLSAESPGQAAQLAINIQRDQESTATVFWVEDTETGEISAIDLLDGEHQAPVYKMSIDEQMELAHKIVE